MNQSTNSNKSLAQLLNLSSNSKIVHKLFCRSLDMYLGQGLITEKERRNLSMKASLSDDFLYEQFVASRHELATTQGYPLDAISNKDLLGMLKSGIYSWEALEIMNEETYAYLSDRNEWDLEEGE